MRRRGDTSAGEEEEGEEGKGYHTEAAEVRRGDGGTKAQRRTKEKKDTGLTWGGGLEQRDEDEDDDCPTPRRR